VTEYTNNFHTLRTKLGIKDFKRHLVLKYCSGLHRYIRIEMEFLDILSLGAAYRFDKPEAGVRFDKPEAG
jgi:hypothetical protein